MLKNIIEKKEISPPKINPKEKRRGTNCLTDIALPSF